MDKAWKRYSWLFHIIGWVVTLAFTAGVVWAGVSGYGDRINRLEESDRLNESSIAAINGKIDVLLLHFRLKYAPLDGDSE